MFLGFISRRRCFFLGIGIFVLASATSPLVMAGNHRALCDKVAAADLVFEMTFTPPRGLNDSNLAKNWAPKPETLNAIAATGTITRVFKGDVLTGDRWKPAYPHGFTHGTDVSKWRTLLKLHRFSAVLFLRKEGERYKTTGWAEEYAGCGFSDQYSWCEGYEAFKKQVQRCR